MRAFLAFLVFLPILVLAATFTWVARSKPLASDVQVELPSLGAPLETEDPLVRKGWEVFTEKGCVYCHGPNAQGNVANNNAAGGTIPGLTEVFSGYSEEELVERILKGQPDIAKEDPEGPTPPLSMPPWEGALSQEELDALVAYLFSFRPEDYEEW